MRLKHQLRTDLKGALRNRDERAKSVIRMALAAVGNAEIEKGAELEDSEVLAVLQKEARQRKEALKELSDAGRSDSLAEAKLALAILERYLPKPLSRDAITDEALLVIAEVGATDMKQVGLVMRELMPRMKGRADGRLVNEVVRELLLS